MSSRARKRKDVEPPAVDTPSKTKRTRRDDGLRRLRKKGSLQDLPNMPLDIIFEVLGYLLPNDLLNLARTTKEFRNLLMSRESRRFWKTARGNIKGLPKCPDFCQ
ncbi:hypothetical protein QCA50_009518 [Cerrena zonata]|uniref:F-box domain-containing protein n=1 Tax=Cerrena zonata TaxID=2478898 RepID=A0AAW0G6E6_9APHY